uniref:Uncharacterized protein n=1 Tax=Heterosigma akashiwo TaxID=2829 RepID=A0A7S3Y257_HETAK
MQPLNHRQVAYPCCLVDGVLGPALRAAVAMQPLLTHSTPGNDFLLYLIHGLLGAALRAFGMKVFSHREGAILFFCFLAHGPLDSAFSAVGTKPLKHRQVVASPRCLVHGLLCAAFRAVGM